MHWNNRALGSNAALKGRDLAQRTFEIMQKKSRTSGAGSSYQTMTAQRDLSVAELDLVTARTIYEKARVELDRATGATLERNGMQDPGCDSRRRQQSRPLSHANLGQAARCQQPGGPREES
jgi:hypothetical protein